MRFITLLTAVSFLSCSSGQVKMAAVPQDTLKKAGASITSDTTDVEEAEPDYRQEYISRYSKDVQVDTTFSFGEVTYQVHVKHYCTWDSALVVPAKYNFDTKLDFRTHNFQTELSVIANGDTAYKKIITKQDFAPLLYAALKSYATLQEPTLNIRHDSVRLFYSISIPVTDVAIGAAIQFDRKGNFTLEQ
jgi:hypothetical protein